METALTLWGLAVVSLLCILGALCPSYDDNLLQRLGLACIGVASAVLMEHVAKSGRVDPACALLTLGLVLFGAGVVVKVIKYQIVDDIAAAVGRDDEVHP